MCIRDRTDTLLVESWISGSDGRYTEQDKFAGDIPTGFEVGDLRPHKISEIPYGTYYIAELELSLIHICTCV